MAQASVILNGTRIVFPADEKEATIELTNKGKNPSLVQAWLDKGLEQESPDNIDVPFIVTPTLFRMEPEKGQAIRILYSGEPLPADRESLFWFNILDMAPKTATQDGSGSLKLSFRTRIKLMYRPAGLPGNASEAPAQLQWSLGTGPANQAVLTARNATAFVVNLASIRLQAGDQTLDAGGGHVLPGATASFALPAPVQGGLTGATVAYSSVNDWGGQQDHEAPLPAP